MGIREGISTMTNVRNDIEAESVDRQWFIDRLEQLQHSKATVHVYFRSVTSQVGAHDLRNRTIDVVETATRRDILDEYDVTILGEELCLCEECQKRRWVREARETIETLHAWSDGIARSTGFNKRELHSWFTGADHETISPPEIAIAVHTSEDILVVFPCVVNGTDLDVAEFLDYLESMTREKTSEILS